MSNKQKTETKLSISPNGLLNKYEAPVEDKPATVKVEFTMPTELRDPGFVPEGTFLLTDIIPMEKEEEVVPETFENTITNKQQNQSGVMEMIDFKVETSKLESGLFAPVSKETKKDRVQRALVVAVGTGIKEGDYEVGDVVIIKPSPMQPNPSLSFLIEIEGHPYLQIDKYLLAGKYKKK